MAQRHGQGLANIIFSLKVHRSFKCQNYLLEGRHGDNLFAIFE